jgi:magnesium-transporting ATPase (P-type)
LNYFNGSINIHGEIIPLSQENLLLKGSSLKNVDEISGIAVYTGKETKLMLNSVKFKPKTSRLEGELNRMVIVIFLMQFGLSLICGVMNMLSEGRRVK